MKKTDSQRPVWYTWQLWPPRTAVREIRSQKRPGEKGSHRSISPTPGSHGIPLDTPRCLPDRRTCWKQEADTKDYHGTNRVGTPQRGRFHGGTSGVGPVRSGSAGSAVWRAGSGPGGGRRA